MIENFSDYIGKYNGHDFVIIGSGGSIKDYKDRIYNFIQCKKTIGINNMTHLFVPDFHVWTNNQRLRDYGSCIQEKSILILGDGILEENIKKHNIQNFVRLNYEDERGLKIEVKGGKIYGYFRTAGCLSVLIAHCLGAKNIYICGMDGYTLYNRDDLKNKKQNHHCYGEGYTDDAGWERCMQKDKDVYDGLKSIREFGVDFNIITPTVFKDFFIDIL